MSKGWIKMHRSVLEHPWLNDRLDWCAAWSHILLSTNYETERVNLTEVYRTLSRHFTKDQWRAFVKKLAADDMLVDFKLENYGRNIGYVQDARVANWDEYQGSRSARSPKRSADAAHTQPETQRHTDTDNDHDGSARSPKRSADAAHTQPETLSYKNTSMQEVKEVKEAGAREEYESSEAKFTQAATTGINPQHQEHSNREHLKRLIGRKNFEYDQIQDNWHSWYRTHNRAHIEEAWTDAHQQKSKAPLYFFIDRLSGLEAPKPRDLSSMFANIGRSCITKDGRTLEIRSLTIDASGYNTPDGVVLSTEIGQWLNN